MGPFSFQLAAWTVSFVALLAAAGTDLKARIIPNACAGLVAASGLLLVLTVRPGQAGLSLLGAVLVFCALGTLAHYGRLGGGDVKLISAATLLVPPDEILWLLAEIGLAGGLLSVFYLAAHWGLRRMPGPPRAVPSPGWLEGLIGDERARIATCESLPYGLAVLGGVSAHLARELGRCFSAISCSL